MHPGRLRGSGSPEDFAATRRRASSWASSWADRPRRHRGGDSIILRAGEEQRRYRISGIGHSTGEEDTDRQQALPRTSGSKRARWLKKTTGASFIQIALFDRDRVPQDAEKME